MPDSELLNKKVAIYTRVSTAYQADGESLPVQRRELIAYSELMLGTTNYEIFEDSGYSGKNTDRSAYQLMMSRLRTGEFSHLLVWKIDRISRNLLDFAGMYGELKKLGVMFVSKNEHFDTGSAIGEAMLKIILVFAELERNMTSERVTAVMLSRANNGQWNGGKIPYGYSYDKETKQFIINEDEANVVRLAYDLYKKYRSVLNVCRHFNQIGLRSRLGKEWSGVTVHKLLSSGFYAGYYVYNTHSPGKSNIKNDPSEWIAIKHHHPAIIDEERYNKIPYYSTKCSIIDILITKNTFAQ